MSDFKILVDAVVNIDQITEQLKKKIEGLEIKLKTDGRSLTTSIEGAATKAGKSAGNTISKEISAKLQNIKFMANTDGFKSAIQKINSEMAETKSKIDQINSGAVKSDNLPNLQKYYSDLASKLAQYEKKLNTLSKTELEEIKISDMYEASLKKGASATKQAAEEAERLNSIRAKLHADENQMKISFNVGGSTNVDASLALAKKDAEETKRILAAKQAAGIEATNAEYRIYEDHYIKVLGMINRYGSKMTSISRETATKMSADIVTQFKNGTLSAEQALSQLQKITATFASTYENAMMKLKGGEHFHNLTRAEKEAIIVTQQNDKTMKGLKKTTEETTVSNQSFIKTLTQFVSLRYVVYALWQAFKSGLTTLKDIDDSLIGIRKVTDMSAESAQQLARSATVVVAEFGRTVQDYLKAYETFAKAGFTEKEIQGYTKLSLLLQNVGDVTAEVANETLIAANAGFKMGGDYDKLSHSIDAMNNISNNNATTVSKMSEAIKVSATVAQVAGFSFDEYISLVGAATTATQREGSEIGRALRTIVANIRQVTDAEGETDPETFAKAGDALSQIAGISLKDTKGEIRDTMEVLTELAGKWSGLNTIQKQQLANDIAGKRQMDIFLSIMGNWTTVEKQLGEAVNSTGSAIQENEIWLDSITAKTAQFNNAVTAMWQNTLDSSQIKSFIDIAIKLVGVIDKLGLANILIVSTMGALSSKTSLVHQAVASLISPIKNILTGTIPLVNAFKQAGNSASTFADRMKVVKDSGDNVGKALSAWSSLITMVLVAAVLAFVAAADKAYKTSKELVDSIAESTSRYNETSSSIENLKKKYIELYGTTNKTQAQYEEMTSVQNKLNDMLIVAREKSILYGRAQNFIGGELGTATAKIDSQTKSLTENLKIIDALNKASAQEWLYENAVSIDDATAFMNNSYNGYISTLSGMQRASVEYLKASYERNNSIMDIIKMLGVDILKFEMMKPEEVFQRLTAAMKEQQDSGGTKFTVEQFKILSKWYTRYSTDIKNYRSVLKQATEAEIAAGIIRNEALDEMQRYYVGIRQTTAATKDAKITQAEYAQAIEDGRKKIEEISDSAELLAEAYYSLSKGEKLTGDQISNLLTKYPKLLQYYDASTNSIRITKQALLEMINAEIATAKVAVSAAADRLLSSKTAALGALVNYEQQVKGLKALSEAEIQSAAIFAQSAAQMQAFMDGATWMDAKSAGFAARRQAIADLNAFNASINTLVALQSKLKSTMSGTSTKASGSSGSGSSAAETAAEKAQNAVSAAFEKIRETIQNGFDTGAISAKEALARVTKEIESLASKYAQIKSRTSDTWTEMEQIIVEHYENLIGMQEDFTDQVLEDYEEAVGKIEDLQGSVVDALAAKYEAEKQAAIDAIEAQREARNEAHDERIAQLEAEKEAIQDTRAEDDANLETLQKKLELSKLDDSVYGKKRTAELEKEVADLEEKIAIAKIDAQIAAEEEANDTMNSQADDKIEETEKTYDVKLEEANLYAEANRLIMTNSADEIVKLFTDYAPQFAGIGQLLGGSMVEEFRKSVTDSLGAMGIINAGTGPTSTAYNPQSPLVSGAGVPGGSTATTTTGGIPYPGTLYKTGSTGATVKRIQENLIKSGYSVGSAGADGIFGSATKAAVSAFQKANGLTIDGIVGAKTWAKLIKFHGGGMPVPKTLASAGDEGIAIIKKKERVLSEKQTTAFDDFVYNTLPKFNKAFEKSQSQAQQIFNDKLVQVDMNVINNSAFDLENNNDNLVRAIKKALVSLGMKF